MRLFAGEGLKRILIGESFVNTARPGQATALNRVWGKSIELLYVDDQSGSTVWPSASTARSRAAGWRPCSRPNPGLAALAARHAGFLPRGTAITVPPPPKPAPNPAFIRPWQ